MMRPDRFGPGVWLAVCLLGWSLALSVAAWAGWGSALPGPAAAADQPPLPGLPDGIRVDAGVLPEGSAVLQRPLFHPSRRPQRYLSRQDAEGGSGPASLRLSGVVITPTASLATLSGEGGLSVRLRLGDGPIQGWQLLELSPRQATISGPQGVQTLLLAVHEQAGNGDAAGMPPTEATPAPRTIAPAPAANSTSAPSSQPAPEPSASQIQAIRERIQARRRQMQQATASGQNPDGNP